MSNSNPLFEGGVIPDVIKELPTQNLGLEVSYGNQIITAGATIPRNVTTEVPDLKITNLANKSADASPKYTIIMTDPDLFIKNDPTGQVRISTPTCILINSISSQSSNSIGSKQGSQPHQLAFSQPPNQL